MSLSEPKKLLLLALLNDKKTWTELKLFLNVTDKTLSEHLKELQAKGLIKKDSEGYFLTDEGKSTLKNVTLNGSEGFIRHVTKDTEYLRHEEAQIIWHFYLTCFIPDWVRRMNLSLSLEEELFKTKFPEDLEKAISDLKSALILKLAYIRNILEIKLKGYKYPQSLHNKEYLKEDQTLWQNIPFEGFLDNFGHWLNNVMNEFSTLKTLFADKKDQIWVKYIEIQLNEITKRFDDVLDKYNAFKSKIEDKGKL